MGRHGGGSRSGGSRSRGSSRSRSSGGSRGGGSNIRTSHTPFRGCYDRTYINRKGKTVHYYTEDSNFGTTSGWSFGLIGCLVFLTLHMIVMIGGVLSIGISFGEKLNGNPERIQIVDTIDLLAENKERDLIQLFQEVYQASGMPVTLYIDDFDYKKEFDDIQIYSERLYYQFGLEEDACLILFTKDSAPGAVEWIYDVYCGDDTIKCFSDACFDEFLSNFHKGLSNDDLCVALRYAWENAIPDMAKTSVDPIIFILTPILLVFYGAFYAIIFAATKKNREAYQYFRQHPEELDLKKMRVQRECPSCGAPNTEKLEACSYCGALLGLYDNSTLDL